MSQNKGDAHMFNIGDVVTVTGKVNYVVAAQNADGSYTAESMNTGKPRVFEANKLKLVAAAETEPMNAPQDVEEAKYAEPVEDLYREVPEDDFDPREDRRQSDYGINILNALLRKNPNAGSVGYNPLKPIGSKRAKVCKRVKAQRTNNRVAATWYNRAMREGGYTVKAA